MARVDLLVLGPHFFTMSGEGVGYQADQAMAVDRGRIVAIGPASELRAAYRAERTLDASGCAVLPGFIDAHMHTGLAILRGLAQDTRNWMMDGLGPFIGLAGGAAAQAGSRLAVVEAVRAGTTTLGEYGSGLEDVLDFLDRAGLRARVTPLIREAVPRIYQPGELYEFDRGLGQGLLDEALRVFDKWHGSAGGRVTVLFGPQGPDFCSRDLLLEVKRLAVERHTLLHVHTAQGDRETAQIELRYGRRPVAWLDELGYLDEHLLAVHLTDATEEEAALVARRGAAMVLCSGSIGIIDGVVPPTAAFQAAGGQVALGSDQAPGNNCHNIINEMKLTALFNKIRAADPEAMPAWRVLRMATIEGARAIGLGDEIGSLEAGKRADFILIDLRRPAMLPVYTEPMRNIVPNLVYSARGDEVTTVVVDGRVIFHQGRFETIAEDEVMAEAQAQAYAIGTRATDEFQRVDGPNAAFMREGKL